MTFLPLSVALAAPLDDAVEALHRASDARVAGVVVTWNDAGIATAGGATSDTPFEIGSTSKLFTGLLLATAVVDERVALDASIDPALPRGQRFPDGPGPTWLALATHTSGLPKLPPNQADADRTALRPYPSEQVLAAVTETRRGDRTYSYSNYGIGLLGEALARQLGTDYPTALQQRVTGPLGMSRTGFLDVPHGRRANGAEAGAWNFEGLQGAGSIDSTAADQQRWLQAWLTPESTPMPEAIRMALAPHHRRDGDQQIGLAWRIRELDDYTLWQHTGSTQGFSTYIGIVPSHHVGVVLLQGRLDTDAVSDAGKALVDALVRGPAAHARAVDAFVKGVGGHALVSVDGQLEEGGEALAAPARTGDAARGFWVALAAAEAVRRGQLPPDRVIDGHPVRDHIARCWSSGAPADDPLTIALLQATGQHAVQLVDRWIREPLGLPAQPLDALRPADLLRVGERGLPEGMPPTAAGEPTWRGQGMQLFASERASAVVSGRTDAAAPWRALTGALARP